MYLEINYNRILLPRSKSQKRFEERSKDANYIKIILVILLTNCFKFV